MNNLNLKKTSLNNHKQNIQNCYWLGQKHHTGFSVCSECSDHSPRLTRLSENKYKAFGRVVDLNNNKVLTRDGFLVCPQQTKGGSHE